MIGGNDMENNCCVLNAGGGGWAFEALALQLSAALWIDVAEQPRRRNYLLLADDGVADSVTSFIPFSNIRLASDKRLVAAAFAAAGVPTPETHLVDSWNEVVRIFSERQDRKWCLKYPTGCGAAGHRILTPTTTLPSDWPLPLVVQEFVPMSQPEVYRLFGAGGETFGWVARRYPPGVAASPWVAHARGARYELAGEPPPEVVGIARSALDACGLLDSFGCVDLIRRDDGEWVALEVGTDGMFNHVDRDLGIPTLEREIQRRIAEAFWAKVDLTYRPWGGGEWFPKPLTSTTSAASPHL